MGRSDVKRQACLLLLVLLAASIPAEAQSSDSSQARATTPVRGLILRAAEQQPLEPCADGLALAPLVDSTVAARAQLFAARADVHGRGGLQQHATADAVYYVASGWGEAVAGTHRIRLGPGSVLYVPAGQSYRLASAASTPMRLFFALRLDADAPRRTGGAAFGCATRRQNRRAPGRTAQTVRAAGAHTSRVVAVAPTEGDRISYCVFPLTITAQIDSDNAPDARLTAATGALRRGMEAASHRTDDEVVFVTHGRGRAFVGGDTAAVEAGSVVFTPRGLRHGFINESDGTLEYFIVFSEPGPRELFRRFAARPGPYCPGPTP